MENKSIKMPGWYLIVSVLFLLWNLMGVVSFYQHIAISNSPEALAALPPNEAELYGKYPLWTHIAFAISVLGGVLGCIGLVMKRKWAKPVFVVSLISILAQMAHSLLVAGATEVYGPGAVIMPVLVILIGAFLVWFADHGIKKRWLT